MRRWNSWRVTADGDVTTIAPPPDPRGQTIRQPARQQGTLIAEHQPSHGTLSSPGLTTTSQASKRYYNVADVAKTLTTIGVYIPSWQPKDYLSNCVWSDNEKQGRPTQGAADRAKINHLCLMKQWLVILGRRPTDLSDNLDKTWSVAQSGGGGYFTPSPIPRPHFRS